VLFFVELQPLRKEQAPEQESRQDSPSVTPAIETPPPATIEPTTSAIDTSDWKVYRNEEYGFAIVFPREMKATRPVKQTFLDEIMLTPSDSAGCNPEIELMYRKITFASPFPPYTGLSHEERWRVSTVYHEHAPSYGKFTTFQDNPAYIAIPDRLDKVSKIFLDIYSRRRGNTLELSLRKDLTCIDTSIKIFKDLVNHLRLLEEF